MPSCGTLRVQLSGLALEVFSALGVDIPWDSTQERKFECQSGETLTIQNVADNIAGAVQVWYMAQTGGEDRIEVRVRSVRSAKDPEKDLSFEDAVDQHLIPGDTIITELLAMTDSMMKTLDQEPEFTEEDLQVFRECLRFALNDRVLCNCGPRWLPGHIVGTAVPDANGILPYLVKTDPMRGLPSKKIVVLKDTDEACVQEICFDPHTELRLTNSAAHALPDSARPTLRFKVGDAVVCRIRNNADDGLEQWASGEVSVLWPQLPSCASVHHNCEASSCGSTCEDLTSMFDDLPSFVPYKVDLKGGKWVYCHRDHHTLIRREGMQPLERVCGVSKRMEIRDSDEGGSERVDHETGRRKRILDCDSEESL